MIYADTGQKLSEMKVLFSPDQGYRMAVVDHVAGGRPMVRFFGEDGVSQKKYKYLQSYNPAAGDTVLTAKIGNSYVILGRVV